MTTRESRSFPAISQPRLSPLYSDVLLPHGRVTKGEGNLLPNAPPCVIPAKAGIQYYIYLVKQYYVSILASKRNGTLYIGITGDLLNRVKEHSTDLNEGFTKKYQVHQLVYYETYDDPNEVIWREKSMKEWKRKWKIELIEENNPDWKDLYYEIGGEE